MSSLKKNLKFGFPYKKFCYSHVYSIFISVERVENRKFKRVENREFKRVENREFKRVENREFNRVENRE